MGYRIEYESVGRIPHPKRKKRTGIFVASVIILLVLCAITVKTIGLEWVQEVLLPGDPHITAQALENMVEDLREGEGVIEAIKTFCKDIMQNASLE
ncbi:MAG: hypothetical protein IJF02_03455 [Oscillospiraceae bacterium]|nr:hypothetical protein [Oscillospiraceae bacterium]